MSRPKEEQYEWRDDGDLYRVKDGRVERWWPHERVWAHALSYHAATELIYVVAERNRALEELADLRGVSIDSLLESYRVE